MANDELYTPKYIFDALGLVFDLDPCSPETGAVVPTRQKYSLPFDGLEAAWFGLVWMNPPFSKPSPWVDRWLSHANGIALLPMGGNARWLNKIWESQAQVIVLPPNIGFINPKYEIKTIMYRIALWAIGDQAIEALHQSGLGKMR
jgi:hypothetical protein